jgi:Cellobiohydrolase A (1,4-beta-cellobiosidase A)
MDIAHSAWLGWPNNMSGTPAVYNTVVKATTAGYASIDGFISDTANYTPTQEPLLTNPTLQINGQNVDSATSTSSTRRSTSSPTTPRCTTRWWPPGSRRARSS